MIPHSAPDLKKVKKEYHLYACWQCRHSHEAHEIVFPVVKDGRPVIRCKDCIKYPSGCP